MTGSEKRSNDWNGTERRKGHHCFDRESKDKISAIHDCLVGDLDKPGLISKVGKNTDHRKFMIKLGWTILAGHLTAIFFYIRSKFLR